VPELLDVEGDMNGLDPLQPVDPSALAPSEELSDVVVVEGIASLVI
jgi:hypothetical protein